MVLCKERDESGHENGYPRQHALSDNAEYSGDDEGYSEKGEMHGQLPFIEDAVTDFVNQVRMMMLAISETAIRPPRIATC